MRSENCLVKSVGFPSMGGANFLVQTPPSSAASWVVRTFERWDGAGAGLRPLKLMEDAVRACRLNPGCPSAKIFSNVHFGAS